MVKSSAHALLRELSEAGLLQKTGSGRYRLGWRLLELARTMLGTFELSSAAGQATRQLADHFGETTHLATVDRDTVVYVVSAPRTGSAPVPRDAVRAADTPLGQVVLAARGDAAASATLTGAQKSLENVDCVAAPITGREGNVIAAIGICAGSERVAASHKAYEKAVTGIAKRLSASVRP